jgi:mannose-6-phosphate isomerase
MGSSDNVLRGGLTPKHVDVGELLSVLDFRALPAPRIHPEIADGVAEFRPAGAGFRLRVLEPGAVTEVFAPAIGLGLTGSVEIGGVEVSSPGAVAISSGAEQVRAAGRWVVASAS